MEDILSLKFRYRTVQYTCKYDALLDEVECIQKGKQGLQKSAFRSDSKRDAHKYPMELLCPSFFSHKKTGPNLPDHSFCIVPYIERNISGLNVRPSAGRVLPSLSVTAIKIHDTKVHIILKISRTGKELQWYLGIRP
jgi:hypothetical protein